MIRRPQDLKSIRNAISAGSRAVAAATSNNTTTAMEIDSPGPAGIGGNSTSMIQLPLTTDLQPPRGIVNAAQLEQEIMRMFANAVMFNPGDLGVVRDAREMCEGVEDAVAKWRAADRTTVGGGGAGAGANIGTGAGAGSGGIGKADLGLDDEADELGAGHGLDESSGAAAGMPAGAGLPSAAKRRRAGA